MGHDIFISFSSKEQHIADSVYKYLTDNNITCWYSKTNIVGGGRYYKDIVNAIKESKILLLIYSFSALQSRHINTEVDMAFSTGKVIIPYQIENVPLNDDFEYFLRSFQFVPAFSPEENEVLKFQRLLDAVQKHLEVITKKTSSMMAVSSLTSGEQRYVDGLNKALEDAQISETERAKLEGMMDALNISPDRAKELEQQVKMELAPKLLTDEEQKYIVKLREALKDGQISEIERAKLEGFIEAIDLSQDRAKELEELVQNEIKLVNKQEVVPTEAPVEEVDYDERYNNRDIAYRLAEELNATYSDQLRKFETEFSVYQPRQEESACISCWFPFGEVGFTLEAWVASKEIGLWGYGSNQTLRDFGKKWFEIRCNSITARPYTEGKYFLELWKVEYTDKTEVGFREQQFKEKVFESLNIILPELLKTSVALDTIKEFIDNLVSAFTQEFPSSEGWEVAEDAKSLAPCKDIYVYKTGWKRDNLDRPGVFSYAIECSEWNFDNLSFGIGKGTQNINLPNDLEDSLYKDMTNKLGNGDTDGWWVYCKDADENYRNTGGSEFSSKITSKEQRDEYVRYYVDVFRKMKEVTPLIDEIVSKV